eukprot:m.19232 g.19232  ORF g.19232 m.19232 type:complete len:68 (-) comp6515_c0_seq1:78-281(-)
MISYHTIPTYWNTTLKTKQGCDNPALAQSHIYKVTCAHIKLLDPKKKESLMYFEKNHLNFWLKIYKE